MSRSYLLVYHRNAVIVGDGHFTFLLHFLCNGDQQIKLLGRKRFQQFESLVQLGRAGRFFIKKFLWFNAEKLTNIQKHLH